MDSFKKSYWPANGQKKRKGIIKIFKDIGFSIEIQPN